ncbi:hypothetical protein HH1059_09010 [Halorhodospira halochloris]|uniref:Uncharacterized protein n=1 Tax=Halorhodospira halochloris TaxID=1052 RepID=A0A2Z6EZF8_HALHR|nr:hypothetical protein HH1059_09010 [Halorhodospira halochloris]
MNVYATFVKVSIDLQVPNGSSEPRVKREAGAAASCGDSGAAPATVGGKRWTARATVSFPSLGGAHGKAFHLGFVN